MSMQGCACFKDVCLVRSQFAIVQLRDVDSSLCGMFIYFGPMFFFGNLSLVFLAMCLASLVVFIVLVTSAN